jgi:CheY-like chemotaxis protein
MNNLPDPYRKAPRILLVEDHEDTNRSLSLLLERRGYAVLTAATVTDAVRMAAQHEFDILVSDIGLPDGSGIELMQQLTLTRPVRGIALTGFGMEEDVTQSRAAGFSHHLVKPVDLNRLDFLIQQMSKQKAPAPLTQSAR